VTSPPWKPAPKAGLPAFSCGPGRARHNDHAEPEDVSSFIQSFTGSHHFVLDYLVQEVLHQQPKNIQTFLLRTSILERMCGPLCDAVANDPSLSGQQTLEYLERTNLFIIPLDSERCWYRYHHLFAIFCASG